MRPLRCPPRGCNSRLGTGLQRSWPAMRPLCSRIRSDSTRPHRTSFVLTACLIVVAAYLIGSVSFAVVVSKAFGLPDPHEYGSGNPGATNVLRTGNKAAALLTLAGDGIKGWVGVVLAQWLAAATNAPEW